MKLFIIDNSEPLSQFDVMCYLDKLMQKRLIWTDTLSSTLRVYTRYESAQEDGTHLALVYIDDENEPLLINYDGDTIIQGYFLVGYESSFGNPLPYIIRNVINTAGLEPVINIRTDYLALEEIERQYKAGTPHEPLPNNYTPAPAPACSNSTTTYTQESLF